MRNIRCPGGYSMNKKIVVVDDDPKVILVVEKALIQLDFEVFSTGDGNKALELVKKNKPAVLVSDILIPGIDGAALCGLVKNDPEFANTKVILITGVYKDPSFRAELDSSADDFLEKPIDIERLVGIVTNQVVDYDLAQTRKK